VILKYIYIFYKHVYKILARIGKNER